MKTSMRSQRWLRRSLRSTTRLGCAALRATGALVAAGGAGWLGLQIPPRSQPPTPEKTRDLGAIPLPSGLPAPVEMYLRAASGDRMPRIETEVTWGTARMRLGPFWLPLRFQMIAIPGQAFARRMQITWFALPVFKGLDTYLNGEGEMKVGNTVVRGPEIDQGANLALWAEALSTPGVLVTDPRVRWEPIDDQTARLIVPCGSGSDQLLVHFDPQTGLIREITADRFRTPGQPKEPWKVELGGYKTVHGACIATKVAVTWERDGRRWSVWSIEGVEYNVDVTGLLRAPAISVASRTITAR